MIVKDMVIVRNARSIIKNMVQKQVVGSKFKKTIKT
jgi:hypothetical protein